MWKFEFITENLALITEVITTEDLEITYFFHICKTKVKFLAEWWKPISNKIKKKIKLVQILVLVPLVSPKETVEFLRSMMLETNAARLLNCSPNQTVYHEHYQGFNITYYNRSKKKSSFFYLSLDMNMTIQISFFNEKFKEISQEIDGLNLESISSVN